MQNWKRTFWVVWTANLVTAIGMMSFLPFFPSLLEDLGVVDDGAKRAWAGVIFAAAPLTATLMSPVWGALGDRYGRKLMVCRAMFAISLFVGCMYLASTPWQLLGLRAAQGFFSGFVPPSITLVSVAAPPDRQGRISGNLATALALGSILGPMTGGFLATWTGSHRFVFLFVSVAALLSALLVALFAEEQHEHRQGPSASSGVRGALGGALRDLRAVLANPALRGAALVVFALQFGLGAVNPLIELLVRDLLALERLEAWSWISTLVPDVSVGDRASVETLATSLLFGGMAVTNLIALPLWGRYGDRVGHARAMMLCAAICVFALGVQALAGFYALLLVGRLLMGAAIAGAGPLAFGLAAAEVPSDRRGGAFGVVFSARTLATAVGGVSGGLLSVWIGVRGLMAVSALLLLAVMLVFRRAPDQASTAP